MLPAFASFRQAQARSGASALAPERGKAVARIVPAGELNLKPKLDLAALAKFRACLPRPPLVPRSW